MSRITILLLLTYFNVGLSYGMECSFGNKNIISKVIDSCPGLLDSSDKSYCCYDFEKNEMYCCDAVEFASKSSWILLTVICAVGVVFFVIIFCISCLCCSCCPWYRRRHQGTVYGTISVPEVQVPSMMHVIQTPANVTVLTPYANLPYPTNSAGIQQASTYSGNIYEKQAPYNPNYVSSIQQ
ncbi:uncharacterized protein LOC102680211 isoform X1 [Apis dorsata]|uniref:uncharacterized protein LOC102680211 isoform X1 n=1 Tax=Apis dorsata TaxID=7462 RepID=UPI0003DF6120|nr:uncharacterized protein LOC102680211 isoform X1 [Apis dorsata]